MYNAASLTIKDTEPVKILRSGQSAQYVFSGDTLSMDCNHRLFFTCEDTMYAGLKSEQCGDKLYMLIDDALDTANAQKDRFCLAFGCDSPKEYLKCVIRKISFRPLFFGCELQMADYGDLWRFGVFAKAENLRIEKGGYCRMRIQCWNLRDGVDPGYTGFAPDATYFIDFKEGSYPYTEFSSQANISRENTACVLVSVEGTRYSGDIYIERPFFISTSGYNMLSEFERSISGLSEYAWLGLNISKKEWPEFSIAVNGETFFCGETFLRIHRFSPIEIDIPRGLLSRGENTLTITYDSHYPDTVPISLGEIHILEKEISDFCIHYCPDVIHEGQVLHILAETQKDNVSIVLESDDFETTGEMTFPQKGLQVISLTPVQEHNNLSFNVSCKDKKETFVVARYLRATEDKVVCGSGDMVYIDVSDEKAVRDFFVWFLKNKLGNLITIRTVYRWGGQRTVNPCVWESFCRLCNELEISYVHIADGRDLPGIPNNPTEELLSGKYFLGRQLHERDGQLFYWDIRPRETHPTAEVFYDLAMQLQREFPHTTEGAYRPFNVSLRDGKYSYRRDNNCAADMKEAHHLACKALKDLNKNNFTRHTGPSVMFKYFYEQGFDWTGAETMDGAMEPQLAFIRGAAKAYGKDTFGVHHALQWSTFPHNTQQRYRRYALALIISYMHGVTDINTEEGFWFMESCYAYHNRLSEPCEKHRSIQRDFHRYVQTHSRTGTFSTPFAFLHGRYDGWNGFLSPYQWGMSHMPSGEESSSWELLKLFYPLCKIEKTGMEKTGYIPENNNQPFGIYSGTPHGNADVIPVENGRFSDYSILCFAGYNAADTADFDNLYSFVQHGGTLIGGWPHFSVTTDLEDIHNNNHTIISHPLSDILSCGIPQFSADTYHGEAICICTNLPHNINALEFTDSGKPLAFSVPCGKGQLVFINSLSYPGNRTILPVYENVILSQYKSIADSMPFEVKCGNDVGYSVYKQDDGSHHIYMTAVDWYNEPHFKREATLRVGQHSYPVSFAFGTIVKVIVTEGCALWTTENETEICKEADSTITVWGNDTIICLGKDGVTKCIPVKFEGDPSFDVTL